MTEEEHFTLEKKETAEKAQANSSLSLVDKITVGKDGSVKIKPVDAPALFNEFKAYYWKTKIATIGLIGNRQSVTQKFNVFQEFIARKDRTVDSFVDIAMDVGYNREKSLELWEEFQSKYQREFKKFLLELISPSKKDNNGDIVL